MKIKRFFKTLMIFFTGNVLSKLVSFILLPLYTSALVPEQYGTFDLVMSFINLIAPIAFLQIWDGMFRFSFDCLDNHDKYKTINNAIMVFFVGIIVYTLLFSSISLFLKIEYFIYALIYGFIFAVQYMYSFSSRVFLKNKLFVFSGVANTLITAILNVVLIIAYKWDVKALYVSHIIGTLFQIIIMEIGLKLIKNFSFKSWEKKLVVKMIRFSFPLCIATVSYWLLSGFTKMIIYYQLGPAANGLYAVANKFASTITILITVVQYAWNEAAYLMAQDNDRTKSYELCIDLILKSVCFGSIILCLLIKIIFPYFIDSQYAAAVNIIPATIIGVAVNSVAGFLGTLFMTEKDTGYIMISTLISAGINIILGIAACFWVGLNGVVIALALAFSILMILRLIKLIKAYHIRVDWKNILLIVFLAFGICAFYLCDSILNIIICLLYSGIYLISIKKYLKPLLKLKR